LRNRYDPTAFRATGAIFDAGICGVSCALPQFHFSRTALLLAVPTMRQLMWGVWKAKSRLGFCIPGDGQWDL